MTIYQEKLCLSAIKRARKLNNYIDCDVIQNAIESIQNAKEPEQALDGLAYLESAVAYRKGHDEAISKYKSCFSRTL